MNKYKIAIALTAAAIGLSMSAQASLWDDEKHCAATAASGATPDSIIPACTAVITDGTGGPSVLASAYYNRGNAHYDQKDYALAIADYDHAILLKPKYPMALFNRGLAKLRSGDSTGGNADIAASKAM